MSGLPKNLPFDPNPAKPDFRLPAGAIDAHCHVNGDGVIFPYAADRKYDPCPAPWKKLRGLRDHLGFSGNVIVAATCHGTDNRAMVDALNKSNGTARGVAFVDKDISDAELRALDKAGVRGVRYSYVKRLTTPPPPEEMTRMAERIRALGLKWHIDLYCEAADLAALKPHIEAMETPVVFDHMAVPDLKNGVNDPKFRLLTEILKNRPDHMVKVTCPERLTGSGKPEEWQKALPFAHELIRRFPGQVITGTDWPHPNMKEGQMPNDGDLVNHWIREIAQGDQRTLRQILVINPRTLFDFGPEASGRPAPRAGNTPFGAAKPH